MVRGTIDIESAVARWVGFSLFWLLLASPDLGASMLDNLVDLLVGLFAAIAATWVSLRLLSPTPGRLRYGALLRLISRFLRNSVVSGFVLLPSVFGPRLSIQPGYLRYPARLPAGSSRAAFGALTSAVPGSLAVGVDRDGAILYHCLDLRQPVAAELAVDESLLLQVIGKQAGRSTAPPPPAGDARAGR